MFDDSSEFLLKVAGFGDRQAGVNIASGCQLEVVHFSSPRSGCVVD
jgi:hypothetical protein